MKNTRQTSNLLLKSMILGLIAILAIGCGNSREDFVVTNNNQVNPNGNLVFRFIQAQTATVPIGTTSIQFDLYDGPNGTGNLVDTAIFPFAAVITITDVSPNVQSVVITALGANNIPTGTITDNVVVTPGGTTEVDLSDATLADVLPQTLTLNPDPLIISGPVDFPFPVQAIDISALTGRFINSVLFSNGSTVDVPGSDVTYSNFSNSELLNVSVDGLFQANGNGNTTLDASYTLNGTTVTDSGTVLVEFLECFWDNSGESSVELVPDSSDTMFCSFFSSTGERLSSFGDAGDDFSFEISPAVAGAEITNEKGDRLEVGEGVDVGTTINVVVTYTDPDTGRVFTDTLTATVVTDTNE